MKKLLLIITLATAVVSVKAQSLPMTWYYEAVTGGIIDPALVNASVAFNTQTNNLYVADRGKDIYIVNPDDFDSATQKLKATAYSKTTTLAKPAGFAETSYGFTKVRVTTDGVIYAIAMSTTGTLASPVCIYRWASEGDLTPTRTTVVTSMRSGDTFDVHGTGVNTYLYFAGTPNANLYIYKVDIAGVPQFLHNIDMSSHMYNSSNMDIAKGSISAESNNIIWVKSFTPGVQFKRLELNLTLGTITNTNANATVNGLDSKMNFNYAGGVFLQDNGVGFMATHGATGNTNGLALRMALYKTGVAPGASGIPAPSKMTDVLMPTATFNASGNTQGASDVAIRRHADGTTTFYLVVNKNGLAAFRSEAPLPVSLTSFTGSLVKGESTLTWSTASESNNKGFEVLRSTDGATFTAIDFVNAKSTNGNSATATNYTYVDRSAKAGVNYYQLKQVDLNGNNELFNEVVSVNVTLNNAAVTVYPNPAAAYVNVSTGGADFNGYQYDLFDVNGKKVLSAKATSGEQQISLSGLAPSIYYLKVSKDNVSQNTIKLIKK